MEKVSQEKITEITPEVIESKLKDLKSDSLKAKLKSVYGNYEKVKQIRNEKYFKELDATEYLYFLKVIELNNQQESIQQTSIHNFWKTVLVNSNSLTITDFDRKVLTHLTNIRLTIEKDTQKDFKLEFVFEENEYLQQNVLEKRYFFNQKERCYDKVSATAPIWKKNEENKSKKENFFSLFEAAQLEEDDFYDFEVDIFVTELIPYSLEYYLDIRPENNRLSNVSFDDLSEDSEDNKPKLEIMAEPLQKIEL